MNLTVNDMSYTYRGGHTALQSVSFTARQGELLSVLGPNGAGKSTAIEYVLGTKSADGGMVKIFGIDPKKHRKELFQRIGVLFQQCDYQTEIKVYELCEETACLYKEPADWKELCTRFGIGDKLNNDVKNLSGGERQRRF